MGVPRSCQRIALAVLLDVPSSALFTRNRGAQKATDEPRLVVSEPLGDLPGVWKRSRSRATEPLEGQDELHPSSRSRRRPRSQCLLASDTWAHDKSSVQSQKSTACRATRSSSTPVRAWPSPGSRHGTLVLLRRSAGMSPSGTRSRRAEVEVVEPERHHNRPRVARRYRLDDPKALRPSHRPDGQDYLLPEDLLAACERRPAGSSCSSPLHCASPAAPARRSPRPAIL